MVKGFEYPLLKFVVISETDIFGRQQRKKKKKTYEGQKIQNFSDLKVGDYVVHESHGLGVYKGIEKVAVDKVVKDYIKIEYRDGGNLYVTGMAAGLVIGHLWGHGKAVAQRNAILLAKAEAETTHAREIAELRAEAGRAEAAAESRIRALEAEKAMLDTRLADDRASHAREIEQRDAMMKAAEQQASERAAQFREQLDMAREQLKTTAADLLAARTADLNRANVRDIDNVLQPLRQHIKEMKEAMDASRDINIRNTASLHQAISDIMERTAGIGAEADKLARALRHENKTQGNWGEVILSELLDSQGLKEIFSCHECNIKVQKTNKTKQNKTKNPNPTKS